MQIFRKADLQTASASDPLAPGAAEYLLRMKGDLRLGLPVVLTDGPRSALVAWVETLSAERLAALRGLGRAELALTAHRAAALGHAPEAARGSVAVPLPEGADLDWLRALAGGRDAPAQAPEVTPGSVLHDAVVALAKSEHMLPAGLVVPLSDGAEIAHRRDLIQWSAEGVLDALSAERPHHPVSDAHLPMDVSDTGRVHVFRPDDGGAEHYAIEVGAPRFDQPVTVRLHSSCFTGDVLGSRKCDCGPQLRAAMAAMAAGGGGVLLYLNQEGRGIGLANKMRAYALQDAGLDTVEANHWLGFEDDERDFRIGAHMLQRLGIARVRLLTNNPAKIARLRAQGIDVTERVPLREGITEWNAHYLATKVAKSGHLDR